MYRLLLMSLTVILGTSILPHGAITTLIVFTVSFIAGLFLSKATGHGGQAQC
jgi:hypothetical protein